MTILWRVIRTELRPYARGLALRLFIAMAVSTAPYAFSFLGKWLVDEALQVTGPPEAAQTAAGDEETPSEKDRPPLGIEWKAKTPGEKLRLLLVFLAACMGIHILVTGLSYGSELLNTRMAQHLTYRLRTALHAKVAQLDMARFSRQQVGELMTRVLDDAGLIPSNLINLVVNSGTHVAMIGVGLFLLVRLNPSITLVALIALPVYGALCLVFLPKIQRNAEELRVRMARLNGFTIDRLRNVLTVKNYAQEEREIAGFGEIVDSNVEFSRAQQTLSLVFSTLTTTITGVTTLAVLAFGFLGIKAGNMTLGEALAFYQVTAQLFVPISALVSISTIAASQRVYASRMYGILDTEPAVQDPEKPISLDGPRGDVVFEGVSLRHEEGGPFAVEDVDVSIPAGSIVYVVGATGSGKSTLLLLLTRMYDPTLGTIRIDGADIRDLRLRDLRRLVGTVLHETHVFSGTVAENIAYGAPDATREEIEAAGSLALLHDSIERLPNGYDAAIGAGGEVLSTSELTKLALARALVTEPVVLTIDDAYAALDSESERELRGGVREALKGRTILIATSRLGMCEDADLVVVMRHGKVHQMGTHEELLAAPGTYRRMFMREMGMDAAPENPVSRDSMGAGV
jgi:ABC-type multidrug transport system fused ATPase/permease subunit